MATYLVFDVVDTHGRVSPWRLRITDVTPDADAVTQANALATAAFGTVKPSQGGVLQSRLEIDSIITPISAQPDSDVQQNWQMSLVDDDAAEFRMGLPGRNDLLALYSIGSKVLGNLSESHWVALVAAMFGGTSQVLNTKSGTVGDDILKAISSVRGRKRPREGGSR